MLSLNQVISAPTHGVIQHGSVTVALIAGRVWHWMKNEASYSFQLHRLLLIFTEPIVLVKTFSQTACSHSMQKQENASGIFKPHTTIFGTATMDLRPILLR